MSKNKFVGRFPLLPRRWSQLVTLDLGENNFFGEIPQWIGSSFPNLKIFHLRMNQFNGTIPLSLSKLTNLQILDLSNNNLIGPIPRIFSGMISMTIENTSSSYRDFGWSYQEEIVVEWKGTGVVFQSRTISLLMGIDLSHNSLSGALPKDLMELQGIVLSKLN